MSVSLDDELRELTRGVVDLHAGTELRERLAKAKSSSLGLRVKAGFDPTRPDLHLGHTVLLRKLRQFQDFGHTVIFLVGDYTAMVGDPTGRNKLRPQLELEHVQEAARTYVTQAHKVLDPERTEIRYNSEWLESMRPMDLVKLMAKSTVSQMLERKDFKQRFASEKPIFQHEFLYPLLQGYDSVALNCDVELGGSDQLFNLLVGRDLMPQYGLQPQIVMTMPLLEGIFARVDEAGVIVGEKMSKSADNYVGIDEPGEEQVRKLMLVDDRLIFRYFKLLSSRSHQEIANLEADLHNGRHPKEIKKIFAREIVAQYHGEAAVEPAIAAWESRFEGTTPLDVAQVQVISQTEKLWLPKALSLAKLVASTSQGRNLVEQGGVEVDHVKVKDGKFELEVGRKYLIRVGSKNRKFVHIEVVGT